MNARTAARFTEEPDFDLTQMHLILRAVLSQTTCGPEMPDGLTLQPGNPRCVSPKELRFFWRLAFQQDQQELICIVYDLHPNPHWPLGTFPPTRMHLRTRGPVTCHLISAQVLIAVSASVPEQSAGALQHRSGTAQMNGVRARLPDRRQERRNHTRCHAADTPSFLAVSRSSAIIKALACAPVR
jgi:hypothetical protein